MESKYLALIPVDSEPTPAEVAALPPGHGFIRYPWTDANGVVHVRSMDDALKVLSAWWKDQFVELPAAAEVAE